MSFAHKRSCSRVSLPARKVARKRLSTGCAFLKARHSSRNARALSGRSVTKASEALRAALGEQPERGDVARPGEEGGDGTLLPRLEPLADTCLGAGERDLVGQLVRHGRRCGSAVARKEQLLDARGGILESHPRDQVQVEVLLLGAHPADVEGEHPFHG